MKIRSAIALSATLVLLPLLHAEDAELAEAERILEQGLPTIAAAKLALVDTSDRSESWKIQRAILQARAHLLRGDPEAALSSLEPYRQSENKDVQFWLGEAFAGTGNPEQATPHYAACLDDPALGGDARIGLARMLGARGMPEDGIETLQGDASPRAALERAALLLDLGATREARKELESVAEASPLRDYLRAKAANAANDKEQARAILRQASEADKNQVGAQMALFAARLEMELGNPEGAEEMLEKFIQTHPRSKAMQEAFVLLDQAYAQGNSPTLSELRRWTEDTNHAKRSETALFYLAQNERRLGNTSRAAEAYEAFLAVQKQNPLANAARLNLSALYLAAGEPQRAFECLQDGEGSDIEFARGLAKAEEGNYVQAAELFKVAHENSGTTEAAYNHALCLILAGEQDFVKSGVLDAGEIDLLTQARALVLAKRRDDRAPSALRQAAETLPDQPGIHLARAEWDYFQGDNLSAKGNLLKVSNSDPTAAERAAALAVFLEDSGSQNDEPRAVAAAESFLQQYPNSDLVPPVALKLGEIYFRRGDYLSARERFDQVAGMPDSGNLVDKALFLSAQAAARSMEQAGMEEAIEIYDDLARREGPLALRARLAQAMLLNAQDRKDEAIPILDSILSDNPDPSLRFAATIEKGDTLFSLGENNPAALREAIAVWRLAAEPELPPRWRNQALVKIASASEILGEIPAALSSYYDVLAAPGENEPEYFWFFKAGFDAARLLESEQRFEEAAAIYEKLVAKGGPRSGEATQRLNRLKLENFLWED